MAQDFLFMWKTEGAGVFRRCNPNCSFKNKCLSYNICHIIKETIIYINKKIQEDSLCSAEAMGTMIRRQVAC